jgi:DNA-binding MarR family transcriptional regulator
MEDLLVAIMAALHAEDSQSDHRLAKRLVLSQSQLNRALAILASPQSEGGLGWISIRRDGKRRLVLLTDAGRQLCEQA